MNNEITKSKARQLWIQAQGLDRAAPFGKGVDATTRAVEHLGYVQIDTINVIERCHHHILYSRIPNYRTEHLHQAQTNKKTVFEYWTHALAVVPTKDFRFFMNHMEKSEKNPISWFGTVKKSEMTKVINLIKKNGPVSIRDIDDDVLVEKSHPWASKKPSKKALQFGFHCGRLVISERIGMLKKYELTDRHFNWKEKPKAATEKEILEYLLERSLRSQGLVSVDSICYLDAKRKKSIHSLIEEKVQRKELIQVSIKDISKPTHWTKPETLENKFKLNSERVHILSPFDPLIIQRKRLNLFFDYDHRFEAYLPKEKRIFGYFALPILIEDQIVAAIDLKTDRQAKKLLMQKWNWIGKSKSASIKKRIEEELHRFEKFQLQE